MNILEILRNINLGDNQYNIVGFLWFFLTTLFLYWFYLRCGHEKYRPIMAIAFAVNSVIIISTLTDEINLWVFMLTRENFFSAYVQYWSIPDKYARTFIVLAGVYILTAERFDFHRYWNRGGLIVIIGVTTAYAIVSIFTGMYGWRTTDPTNLAKYFYTYVLYYLVLFVFVFWFYPNWMQLKLHFALEHPELFKNEKGK